MADGMLQAEPGGVYRGEHACLIYEDGDEYLDTLVRTLERAGKRRQRVLWIRQEPDTGPVQDVLERATHPGSGLQMLTVADSTFALDAEGDLDRATLIQHLRQETIRALEDGYAGLQVIQEMGGWLESSGDPQTVRQYETALSTFLPGSSCSVLCLYDLHRCDPQQLLTLLEAHPQTLVEGEVAPNIYAISPEDLLELDVPTATLRRRIRNLVEHRRAEKARRMHTDLVELLHEAAWAGHRASTTDEVMQIVLERVCRHIGWSAARAFRMNEERGELVPAAQWYVEEEESFQELRDRTDEGARPSRGGLAERCARQGEAIWIEDVDDETEFRRRTLPSQEVRSALAMPVASDGRVLAVFEFFSGARQEEDPDLLEVLEGVGQQLAEVLDRKEAEDELLLLESAVSHLEEAILVMTPDLDHPDGPMIVYVNPAVEKITGEAPDEVVGQRLGLLFGHKTDRIVRRRARLELSEGDSASGEVVAYRKDDSEFVLQWHMAPVRTGDGPMTHVVAVHRDVTDERRAEEAIRRADHDSLTGLPNRDLFLRRLERSVERVQKEDDDDRFAVLFLDLDRFKVVNDSLGHLRGDQLLVALARRLERTVRPGDTVARFGGDEFVILLDRVDALEDVTAVARRIEQELESPFAIGSRSLYTTASIGIALSDTGYKLPEDVLRDADAAMYRAKSKGGGTYEVFDQTLYDDAVSVLRLETELHHAVDRGDFELHYQPIVSLGEGRTLGFEALLRWNHPERGLLPPGEFLGLAEETGLIVPIGHWVLDEAGRQLQSWQDRFEAATHLSLSVNLSAREFSSESVVPTIRKVLRDHSLFSGTLQIEITENALIDRPGRVEDILHELGEMGVRICLDDFGTGYSSLSYLQRFPVKVLKIDRLFVGRLANGNGAVARNEEIIRAIVALARNLELEVTAEGVETRTQLRRLQRMDCANGQGYYFSRPLTAGRVEKILGTAEKKSDDGNGSRRRQRGTR